MIKMKGVIKNLAELSWLKKKHPVAIQTLDLEGYQTEIDVELKKLLKTY